MDEKRALDPAQRTASRSLKRFRSAGTLSRLQHLLWAGAVAFVMLAVLLFEPLSQLSWIAQSRLGGHQPSGDIVFVGTSNDIEQASQVNERRNLVAALRELDKRGADRIYLDFVLKQGEQSALDEDLAQALADLGPRVTLTDQVRYTTDGLGSRLVQSDPQFATAGPRVVVDHAPNYLGYVWSERLQYRDDSGSVHRTLPAALAKIEDGGPQAFQIDYGFDSTLIPALTLAELLEGEFGSVPEFAGKTVIIGPVGSEAASKARIPGSFNAPESFVSIYAAESLKSGRTGFLSGFTALVIFSALLALITLANLPKRYRRISYALVVCAIPALLVLGARFGVRMELSYVAALVGIYALLRSRARWRLRVARVDSETGLTKLRVLEKELSKADDAEGHVVVARLHGFERAMKTLGSTQRALYVHRLVDRLRAADSDLTIFIDGHFLAWHSSERESERLIDHLEGLRAIFAAPIQVGDDSVDVGITFGLASLAEAGADAVAAAAAAAEDTSEAHHPIRLAKVASRHDELWDISLRARIDDAMQAGEIYCVYQPKVDTIAGTLIGVEALVRWHDPERGFISPMKFIAQCEKAGRMEHLTRYVLQTACNAGRLLHFRGNTISMSVNISATLLGDMRIVGIVRNTLQATGFDPRFLILEITETSRIGNMETASAILTELKSLGLKISIDDFGVGSANFETLFGLPFDELKIDRLFVDSISRSAKARAITSSMVAMGNAARITVVAEGAEDGKTLQILNEIGCRYVQGYALARPLSLTNLLDYNVSLQGSKTGT